MKLYGKQKGKIVPCPRCHTNDDKYAALSRRDNRTYICSNCGEREAFEDMGWETYHGLPYWQMTGDKL